MTQHRCLAEEELLELVLAGESEALGRLRSACARCAAGLAELESLVARARAALADEALVAREDARRIAGAALARTTREDPSLRGDLRLVARYVGEELRRSRLLRLVAASLLVHLLALPVLAWYGFLRPRPAQLVLHVEAPREPAPFAPETPESLAPLEQPAPDLPGDLQATRASAAERARERLALRREALALPPARADEGALERLLRARAALRAGAAAQPARRAPAEADGERGALAQVLAAELALDRLALEGGASELERALAALDPTLAPRELEPLVRATLERAERLGALSSEQSEALERARARAGATAPLAGTHGPSDRAWLEALERALPASERGLPVVSAWLERR